MARRGVSKWVLMGAFAGSLAASIYFQQQVRLENQQRERLQPTAVISTVVAPTVAPRFSAPDSSAPQASAPRQEIRTSGIEATSHGELRLYTSPVTYVAHTESQGLRCPMAGCELLDIAELGSEYSVDGVIDGEALQPGNTLWYRTRIGNAQVYLYSADFQLKE